MPISYSIDQDRRLILEVWTGDITARVLRSYWRSYLADPQVLEIRRTLVDLRQCNLLLSGIEMWSLVDEVVIPALAGRDWKTAIVVASNDHYGFSRQYQIFAQRYSTDAIFQDRDRALRWILEQQPSSSPGTGG